MLGRWEFLLHEWDKGLREGKGDVEGDVLSKSCKCIINNTTSDRSDEFTGGGIETKKLKFVLSGWGALRGGLKRVISSIYQDKLNRKNEIGLEGGKEGCKEGGKECHNKLVGEVWLGESSMKI